MTKKIARIINGKIVYTETHAERIKPNETASRSRREAQRVKFRKELLQRNQVDYYRAYPDQAKNLNEETRRLLS